MTEIIVVLVLAAIALAVAVAAFIKRHPEDPRVVAFESRLQGLEARLHLTTLATPAPTATPAVPPTTPPTLGV